ncbi:hypothetical protein V7S43_007244 [Phytophthora oleae]|uniref:Uncharacterized protein n=1 Tax=Phytophthora oleae TaxID=2107226 RepID=A0ABD3FPR0_9STRA
MESRDDSSKQDLPPTSFSRARPKAKKLKKDGTPYKPRKGWGPYRSVPNERSAAFNLQLDVQNLQQEVKKLLALREILQTKVLLQRHTQEGSLSRLVNEYLYVFRKGVMPLGIVEERDQRAFMHSVMDPDVELGPGLPRGPDVIMDQMENYCNFLRFVSLTGVVDSIVVAEDSVMVSDAASFVFHVTRSTIEMIFPHIMGEEWLVAQLVGQEAEAQGRSTFHFNTVGKCYRYDVEMDFMAAFMGIVKDPRIVDMLLGRALIAYNGMIGISADDWEPEDEEKAPAPDTDVGSTREDYCQPLSTPVDFCQRLVDDYFSVFASGFEVPSSIAQDDFFLYHFSPQSDSGGNSILSRLKERWRVLHEAFEVLSFHQQNATQMDCDSSSTCQVSAQARYILRITSHTIETVFPSIVSNESLVSKLVGKVVVVPAHLLLSVEKSTGYISALNERLDLAAGMADILPNQRELYFVISQARLDDALGQDTDLPPPLTSSVQTATSTRTMSITDILN